MIEGEKKKKEKNHSNKKQPTTKKHRLGTLLTNAIVYELSKRRG